MNSNNITTGEGLITLNLSEGGGRQTLPDTWDNVTVRIFTVWSNGDIVYDDSTCLVPVSNIRWATVAEADGDEDAPYYPGNGDTIDYDGSGIEFWVYGVDNISGISQILVNNVPISDFTDVSSHVAGQALYINVPDSYLTHTDSLVPVVFKIRSTLGGMCQTGTLYLGPIE